MKRLFYFIAFLMLMCSTANAQGAGEWFGHYKNDIPTGYIFGRNMASTYRIGIFLPGKNSPLEGLSVDSVRFPIIAEDFTDVHVWVSKGPIDISNIDNRVIDIAVADDQIVSATRTWNSVSIGNFQVPDEGMFVGYDFTIKNVEELTNFDNNPIIFTNEKNAPRGSFFMKVDDDNYYNVWTINTAYGTTPLQVFVSGEVAQHSARLSNRPGVYGTTVAGQDGLAHVNVINTGVTTIKKVEVELTTPAGTVTDSLSFWNEDYAQRAISLGVNPADYAYTQTIISGDSATFFVKVPAYEQQGTYEMSMRIVSINDSLDNALAADTYTMKIKNTGKSVPRTSVLETFTSNRTSWGGYANVGHAKAKEAYGDKIIPVTIRDGAYIDDPIPFTNYDSDRISVRAWPRSHIDCHGQLNPYNGWNYDGIINSVAVANTFATTAEVTSLSAQWVEDATKPGGGYIDINSNATFYFAEPENTFEMGYYLLADSVYKDDPEWYQDNMFAVYTEYGYTFPDDLSEYAFGDARLNMAYDYLAVNSSWRRDYNTGHSHNEALPFSGDVTEGSTFSSSYTMELPNNEDLLNAIKKNKLRIAALLIDRASQEILNAAEVPVSITLGINSISDDLNNGADAYYNTNGMRLAKPEKGINIVRKADGSVRKVVVK